MATYLIPSKAFLLTQALRPSGTSSSTTTLTDTPCLSTVVVDFCDHITLESLIQMGLLAQSADFQVVKLETSIPAMIVTSFNNVVTPMSITIDALAISIARCE